MNKIIFTVFLVFFVKVSFSQKSDKLQGDTIAWSESSRLVKEDFQSKAKGSGAAFTASGLHFEMKESEGTLKFYVQAVFLKSKSFMKDDSPYLLKHEQLHFDITELYARKFRQRISQKDFMKVKHLTEEVKKISAGISSELNHEQDKYDTDTEHGLNPAKQQAWIESITKQIQELQAFSSTEIDIVNK